MTSFRVAWYMPAALARKTPVHRDSTEYLRRPWPTLEKEITPWGRLMGCHLGGLSSVIYTGHTAHLKSWLPSPACYPDFLLSLTDDSLLPKRPRLASRVLFSACQLTMTHILPHVLHLARCKLCCICTGESCGCILKTHHHEPSLQLRKQSVSI